MIDLGSYPHAQQFYYAEGRGHIERDPAFMDINPNDGDEETADTARLLPNKPPIAKKPLKSGANDVPTETKRGQDTSRDNKPAPSKPADKPSDKPDRPEKPTASSAIDSDKKNVKSASSAPSQDHSDRKKMVKSPPATPARNAKSASSAPEPGPTTTTQTTTASNSGKDASEDLLLPPPPPPDLPPPVVPDENQDDDDDDVDASEENSAMLFKTGAGVNAADLVHRQLFRKRSLALDKRGNEDDLLGMAAETTPEKADNANNNDDLLSGIEGVSDFVTVVADPDDGTTDIANNNNNNNTSAASKQSKPKKAKKRQPPPAPTL